MSQGSPGDGISNSGDGARKDDLRLAADIFLKISTAVEWKPPYRPFAIKEPTS